MARKPDNVYEKIERIKTLLSPLISGKQDKEVKRMLCHIVHFKIGRRKEISKEERVLYDFLLKNNLKPKTLYGYYLALDFPPHVKKALIERKIGFHEAQSRSFAFKRMMNTRSGKEIMNDILNVIRGLEWKGQNTNKI